MTLLWRPEGWDNPYTIDKDYESGLQGVAYEAGADAILEALRETGIHFKVSSITLVTIPDEEVK